MKILIIGGNGMLGHKLVSEFQKNNEVWTTLQKEFSNFKKFGIFDQKKTFSGIDVKVTSDVENIIKEVEPDIIFNAVGIVKQRNDSKNITETLEINSIFPHKLAELAKKYKSKLILFSTDCVFNGIKGNYTESDQPDAADLYGISKRFGEINSDNCLTIRTSIIGRELISTHSLLEWFLSQTNKKVLGYENAIFSGFPTIVLAEIFKNMLDNFISLNGIYHISSTPINKYELLKLIKKYYEMEVEIEPFGDFRIDRSLDSEKFKKKTNFVSETWEKMIQKMVNDPFPYDKFR